MVLQGVFGLAGVDYQAREIVSWPDLAHSTNRKDLEPISHLTDPTSPSRSKALGSPAVARKSSSDLSKPINPDQGSGWFLPIVGLVCLIGIGSVLFLASGRESNRAVAPLVPVPSLGVSGDHWHQAFGVYACDSFQAAIPQEVPSSEGLHPHGSGLIHIHPFSVNAAGNNATIGAYFRTTQAQLTDSTYTPGPFEPGATVLDEAAGCNGEPATLKIAQWDSAFATGEPDRIVTEDLANFQFGGDAGAITLALIPDGQDVPKAPWADTMSQYSPESPIADDGSVPDTDTGS